MAFCDEIVVVRGRKEAERGGGCRSRVDVLRYKLFDRGGRDIIDQGEGGKQQDCSRR